MGGHATGSLQTGKWRGLDWIEGHVFTPGGIVAAFSQHDATSLHFVHGGRIYNRIYNRGFTERGLVTLAKRFAADVLRES